MQISVGVTNLVVTVTLVIFLGLSITILGEVPVGVVVTESVFIDLIIKAMLVFSGRICIGCEVHDEAFV